MIAACAYVLHFPQFLCNQLSWFELLEYNYNITTVQSLYNMPHYKTDLDIT